MDTYPAFFFIVYMCVKFNQRTNTASLFLPNKNVNISNNTLKRIENHTQ